MDEDQLDQQEFETCVIGDLRTLVSSQIRDSNIFYIYKRNYGDGYDPYVGRYLIPARRICRPGTHQLASGFALRSEYSVRVKKKKPFKYDRYQFVGTVLEIQHRVLSPREVHPDAVEALRSCFTEQELDEIKESIGCRD